MILALDPGFTTGMCVYDNNIKTVISTCGAEEDFVYEALESVAQDTVIAVEQPVRIVGRRVEEILFQVSWAIRYICKKRGLRVVWILPSAHKKTMSVARSKQRYATPHELDAYSLALYAAEFMDAPVKGKKLPRSLVLRRTASI